MVEASVAVEKKQKPWIPKVERYLGMHNGTVSGKWFEKSRRARKTHANYTTYLLIYIMKTISRMLHIGGNQER